MEGGKGIRVKAGFNGVYYESEVMPLKIKFFMIFNLGMYRDRLPIGRDGAAVPPAVPLLRALIVDEVGGFMSVMLIVCFWRGEIYYGRINTKNI